MSVELVTENSKKHNKVIAKCTSALINRPERLSQDISTTAMNQKTKAIPPKITKNNPQNKVASPRDKETNVNIIMKHEPDMESKILPHSLKA